MANDIDMWNDLEDMDKRSKEYKALLACFTARYVEGNLALANTLKDKFKKQFNEWGNYY